jgi:hypothetical protein
MFSLKIRTRIFRALAILLFPFYLCFPKHHLNLFPTHKFANGGSQPKHIDPGCDVIGFWSLEPVSNIDLCVMAVYVDDASSCVTTGGWRQMIEWPVKGC